jgi:4'-phosphopantetheinyl transferase EntD
VSVPFERRFLVELPFGTCVGVALPEAPAFEPPAALHPGEAAFARAVPEATRAAWVGGRVALRAALAAIGVKAPDAILATPRGAPQLPMDAVGSVSHKRTIAVALAARASSPRATVGIDVEELRPLRADIARRVLTAHERAALPPDGAARDAAVLRAFSAKEAIYKALDPWVQRFVGFEEATLARAPGGTLTARLALAGGEGPFAVELHDAGGAGQPDLVLVAARIAIGENARNAPP